MKQRTKSVASVSGAAEPGSCGSSHHFLRKSLVQHISRKSVSVSVDEDDESLHKNSSFKHLPKKSVSVDKTNESLHKRPSIKQHLRNSESVDEDDEYLHRRSSFKLLVPEHSVPAASSREGSEYISQRLKAASTLRVEPALERKECSLSEKKTKTIKDDASNSDFNDPVKSFTPTPFSKSNFKSTVFSSNKNKTDSQESTLNVFKSRQEEIIDTLNSFPLQVVMDYVNNQLKTQNSEYDLRSTGVFMKDISMTDLKRQSVKEVKEKESFKRNLSNPIVLEKSKESIKKENDEKQKNKNEDIILPKNFYFPAEICININKCGCSCKRSFSNMSYSQCKALEQPNTQTIFKNKPISQSIKGNTDDHINLKSNLKGDNDNDDETEQLLKICRKYLPEKKPSSPLYSKKSPTERNSHIYQQITDIQKNIHQIKNLRQDNKISSDNELDILNRPFRINRSIPIITDRNLNTKTQACEEYFRTQHIGDKYGVHEGTNQFLISPMNVSKPNGFNEMNYPTLSPQSETQKYSMNNFRPLSKNYIDNINTKLYERFCPQKLKRYDFKNICSYNEDNEYKNVDGFYNPPKSNLYKTCYSPSSNQMFTTQKKDQGKYFSCNPVIYVGKQCDSSTSCNSESDCTKYFMNNNLKSYSSSKGFTTCPRTREGCLSNPDTNLHFCNESKFWDKCNSSYSKLDDDLMLKSCFRLKIDEEEFQTLSEISTEKYIVQTKKVVPKRQTLQCKCFYTVNKNNPILYWQPDVKTKQNNVNMKCKCKSNMEMEIPNAAGKMFESNTLMANGNVTDHDDILQLSRENKENHLEKVTDPSKDLESSMSLLKDIASKGSNVKGIQKHAHFIRPINVDDKQSTLTTDYTSKNLVNSMQICSFTNIFSQTKISKNISLKNDQKDKSMYSDLCFEELSKMRSPSFMSGLEIINDDSHLLKSFYQPTLNNSKKDSDKISKNNSRETIVQFFTEPIPSLKISNDLRLKGSSLEYLKGLDIASSIKDNTKESEKKDSSLESIEKSSNCLFNEYQVYSGLSDVKNQNQLTFYVSSKEQNDSSNTYSLKKKSISNNKIKMEDDNLLYSSFKPNFHSSINFSKQDSKINLIEGVKHSEMNVNVEKAISLIKFGTKSREYSEESNLSSVLSNIEYGEINRNKETHGRNTDKKNTLNMKENMEKELISKNYRKNKNLITSLQISISFSCNVDPKSSDDISLNDNENSSTTHSEICFIKPPERFNSAHMFNKEIIKDDCHLQNSKFQPTTYNSIEFSEYDSKLSLIKELKYCNPIIRLEGTLSLNRHSNERIEIIHTQSLLNKTQFGNAEKCVTKEGEKGMFRDVLITLDIPMTFKSVKNECYSTVSTQTFDVCKCLSFRAESGISPTMSYTSSDHHFYIHSSSECDFYDQ